MRQQAHRTFAALDKNGDGYIEQEEFCMVVEVGLRGVAVQQFWK